MRRERIDLRRHSAAVRLRWTSGSNTWRHALITVGQLTDGQWVLHTQKTADDALVCADMADAVRLAHTWMTKSGRTDWQAYPPVFKSISEPADPNWRAKHDELVRAAQVERS